MPQAPRSLLFTRPKGQGEDLIDALKAANWHCVRQPLLQICAISPTQVHDFQAIKSSIMNLDRYDVVITVSGNASSQAVQWIDQY